MTKTTARVDHPLYHVWYQMKRRCMNVDHPEYPRYGGRGISVCPQWQSNFWRFVLDVGERPAGHSLDRIDNDGNYEPGNVRWATPTEQSRNQRGVGTETMCPNGHPREGFSTSSTPCPECRKVVNRRYRANRNRSV